MTEPPIDSLRARKAGSARKKARVLLDRIGWNLITELQRNARLSYAELGRRVGLTTPAVIERMRRMEEAGIITGYHAEINAAAQGPVITAFVRLKVTRETTSEQVTAALSRQAEVMECHRITGPDSFVLRVAVPTVDKLEALIDHLTRLGRTLTSVVLSTPIPLTRARQATGPMTLVYRQVD